MKQLLFLFMAVATISAIASSLKSPVPKTVTTTAEQLFNCTSYKTNFCIGLKNNVVSTNDEGCIDDRDCDVVVHAYRSQDTFTFHFGCSNPNCVVIFLIHYNKKIVLDHSEKIDTLDKARSSIPSMTPYAEADLRRGKESLKYYMKTLFGSRQMLNGLKLNLRKDTILIPKSLRTTTSQGKSIVYQIGQRDEINPPDYDWDTEPYSIVLIHTVNNKVLNIVDNIDPILLFTDKTRERITTLTQISPTAQTSPDEATGNNQPSHGLSTSVSLFTIIMLIVFGFHLQIVQLNSFDAS